jgi:hypothetical protein
MDAKQVIRGDDGIMRCRECGFGYVLAPAELVERTVPVINHRIRAIAEEDRPSLPYHDENRAVAESQADSIPTGLSLDRLRRECASFQEYVRTLPDEAWDRVGVHERAGEIRLREVAHDFLHELLHHAMDIRRIGQQLGSG